MDLSRYIHKIYFQFTSSLTQLVVVDHAVRRTQINTTIFLQISALEYNRALRIATLVFLFIACIRFLASESLISVLMKRYGRDLVKEVRTLEEIDFKLKKTILDLDFLISCRKNSVFPKFLQFKQSF